MEFMDKEELLECIERSLSEDIVGTVYYSAIGDNKPKRGEIILAHRFVGKEYTFNNQFGRVVQIRTGCGQFGSDMYFLRLPDGSLTTSENQSYRKIPSAFVDHVEHHFTTDVHYEKEGFEQGYTIGGGQPEVGFIVDGKDTKGTPDTSFAITIAKE